MIKLWNCSQVDLLEQLNSLLGKNEIPQEVVNYVRETISILDQNYGADRHPEKDLGGCLYILENSCISEVNEYSRLLEKYNTTVELAEFTDYIYEFTDELTTVKYQWCQQIFILSNDYNVVIVYKDIRENENEIME